MKDSSTTAETTKEYIPLLPLRDVVVYPHMVVPLFVGREKSIRALELAMSQDKQILLVAQKNATEDNPSSDNLFSVGTVSTILQLLKLPDGTIKVLVEGNFRTQVESIVATDGCLSATTKEIPTVLLKSRESAVLINALSAQFERYVKLSKKIPQEALNSIASIDEPERLVDTIAAHMTLKIEEKQQILETIDLRDRYERLMSVIDAEVDLLQVDRKIRGRVKKQMEKSQREYYLNEQMKAIQKELGELETGSNEIEQLEKKIESAGMPKEAYSKVKSELNKLKLMSPMSAEATVVRSYIDWMLSVPWKKRSRIHYDLAKAQDILNQDHYGLQEVKDRILEYLAVHSRVKKLVGPVLCLVGPPGVGKTSLGKSIARATNRKFVRMALGGVRDEAEIRGHRRTYIGSLPGKLVQRMAKAGVKNPLFLLDEIDKMGVDMRGDPASALLEVLDPEQNSTFNDHYLEVDLDLSEIMFICTSNSMNIPAPLLDRMEVIRLPGYTEEEKIKIAEEFLIPKTTRKNGLKKSELELPEKAIRSLIRYYTKEAGVRGLEREVSKICRKVVKSHVLEKDKSDETVVVDETLLEEYNGVRKYNFGRAGEKDRIGQVTGLAWTSVGGELLTIEAVAVKGKGRHVKTGSLGDVMQESIQAALTVVRSRAKCLGISESFHEKHDLHIHVPEGATPKDGPSAGIGMCTALVSVLADIPVRADVAMTGEITLRGEVLKIGGLKEKLLAAHRGEVKHVIIPKENERDLKDIPDHVKDILQIHPVEWIDQVLEIALQRMPTPLTQEEIEEVETESKDKLDLPSNNDLADVDTENEDQRVKRH